jgi:hypothetical protein
VLLQPPDINTANDIEKGDFVLIFQGKALKPSDIGYIYSSATVARREGTMMFAGVARNTSRAAATTKVQVDISVDNSIYKFTQCTAAVASITDKFGICAEQSGGLWGLLDQKVEPDCSYPIAVLVEEKSIATGTDVLCKLLPTKLFNGSHSYNICDTDSALSYAG